MGEALEQRRLEEACRALARLLVPKDRKAGLRARPDLQHLISRFVTLHTLLDDEIKALQGSRSRSDAIALILATDLVWQTIRVLACRKGEDREWLLVSLPADHEASDREVGDDHYARQKQIVDDAVWVFDLHSALRHPALRHPEDVKVKADLLQFLSDPVGDDVGRRLLRAARAIKQILFLVQVDIDPTVRVGSEPVA